MAAGACLLNAAAIAPMAWMIDEAGREGPSTRELSTIAVAFALLPVLAALQHRIGVMRVLRAQRAIQLVLLALLVALGGLSFALASSEQPKAPAWIAGAGLAAALISGGLQWRLWRWLGETPPG